ncbi:MAG: hypothetical protein U9N38_02755 [Thermodesulfobacteriota bacterium]|nr:hypothetical protein [Thermodesulfobacteriota bacterium]
MATWRLRLHPERSCAVRFLVRCGGGVKGGGGFQSAVEGEAGGRLKASGGLPYLIDC